MTLPAGGADFSFTDLSILWPHGAVRLPVIDEGTDLETWSRAESERTCDRRVNAAGRELRAELLRNYTMMARELESVYAASVFPLPTQPGAEFVVHIEAVAFDRSARPTLDEAVAELVADVDGRIGDPRLTPVELPSGPATLLQEYVIDPEDEDGTSIENVRVVITHDEPALVVTLTGSTSDLGLGAHMNETVLGLARSLDFADTAGERR